MGTSRSQRLELVLEHLKSSDSRPHPRKVLLYHRIHFMALARRVAEHADEPAHIRETHVQRTTMPNERQALEVPGSIGAIPVSLARRSLEKTLTLIEADGLDSDLSGHTQLTDLHA